MIARACTILSPSVRVQTHAFSTRSHPLAGSPCYARTRAATMHPIGGDLRKIGLRVPPLPAIWQLVGHRCHRPTLHRMLPCTLHPEKILSRVRRWLRRNQFDVVLVFGFVQSFRSISFSCTLQSFSPRPQVERSSLALRFNQTNVRARRGTVAAASGHGESNTKTFSRNLDDCKSR